ncbi:hypothetical protein GGX14DRAFT_586376 [Mycena pura]|uniref:Uncharacterized protein n=1 Tax=Mycena pura TaxID=153505 RepID=A0AAD6VWS6_9AGAR|nr:hypothetical protein GGX14DRAFT_586376 [Mycena pura]
MTPAAPPCRWLRLVQARAICFRVPAQPRIPGRFRVVEPVLERASKSRLAYVLANDCEAIVATSQRVQDGENTGHRPRKYDPRSTNGREAQGPAQPVSVQHGGRSEALLEDCSLRRSDSTPGASHRLRRHSLPGFPRLIFTSRMRSSSGGEKGCDPEVDLLRHLPYTVAGRTRTLRERQLVTDSRTQLYYHIYNTLVLWSDPLLSHFPARAGPPLDEPFDMRMPSAVAKKH